MPAATPAPMPEKTPLRMACLVGSSRSLENCVMVCTSKPKAATVLMFSTTSAARALASTDDLAASSAYLATAFACKTSGTAMAGTMPKTNKVSCQDAMKDTARPATSTTTWESAIDARSPVRACMRVQSCESRLAKAPALRSGDSSNQPTCCLKSPEKLISRTRSATLCVTTAKLSCRSTAPKEATAPMPRNTSAQNLAPLRMSSTLTLKNTSMNSDMRKPIAGIVKPVITVPQRPSSSNGNSGIIKRQSQRVDSGLLDASIAVV
mmetsp:Transcript_69804/g.123531  ORF Transcript_69804/g.123531 Transcript_69804/m.123531 type:complete len:265 (-) Transcript_69804:791-1585(-)